VSRLRGIRWWQAWLVMGTLLAGAYVVVHVHSWYINLVYDLIALASVTLIVVGVRKHRPARARIWYLFAAGQGLWVIGDFVYGFNLHILGRESFPGPADPFYLVAYPILTTALYVLIRGRTSGRDRAGLIDAAIISTGLGLIAWVYLIEPIAGDHTLDMSSKLVSLAYPAGDLMLLAMVARLLTSPGARTVSYRMLVGAVILLFGTDIVYAIVTTLWTYEGGLIDLGWLMSYVLWATAALHPSMRSMSEVAPDQAPRISAGRLTALAAVSLLAPGLLFQQGLRDADNVNWIAIGTGSVVLFLLVLARMAGLVSRVQDQASQLAALAHNDGLTGVPNRRAWDLELAREMAISRRTGQPLSVAIIDLDHFKQFNDRHGHQAGDRLLTQAAALWRAQLRDQDYLARYGGEEFCVMVTGMAAPEARAILERLLAVTPDNQTFSAGLATWDGVEAPERLVARSDEALYHAKHAGRNRVTLAKPSPAQRDHESVATMADQLPESREVSPVS
jgi:diguanylate cyclase (GGDEF)-like protein